MTHFRLTLLGLSALLVALGGCATPPASEGGLRSFSGQAAVPPQHPGPGWLLLGSNEDGALYMHPRSTLRVGSSAFIVLVGTKRQPVVLSTGVSVGSVRERMEIDCEGRRYRRHDGTAHPDHVALGPILGQMGQEHWRDVPPNTLVAALSSAVCSATAPNTGGAPPEPDMPRFPRNHRGTFST